VTTDSNGGQIQIVKGSDKVILELKRIHLYLSIAGLLISCFGAAMAGVFASANMIVPKIARASMAQDIARIDHVEAMAAKFASDQRENDVEIERKILAGDRQTVEILRGDVALLQATSANLSSQIAEVLRVEHELLLRMDGKGSRA
jgi:hypothetical protein